MSVIHLSKYRSNNKKLSILEKSTYFECIINKESEKKGKYPKYQGVKLGEVYFIIEKNKKSYEVFAIHFPKDIFNLSDVVNWLNKYTYTFMDENIESFVVNDCCEVIEVIKLEGYFLILYQKGNESLIKKEEDFISLIKNHPLRDMKITLVLNGEQIYYIPKIKIDKRKDVLIVNGNCVVSDYIDEFNGNLGFYLQGNPALPLTFIFAEDTVVYIDILEREQGKIFIVEYDYELYIL
ncbi:hypothetical protein [Anaerobranca gottschalkii]|uniref:Uncharacterized protein n=1 Tax=Anaerobranca gottschalkii DSM 13577 TaxID=1120990 RepID=A0A1I0AVC3_9FIRM|nr:hypothetical protein [Anaerobranca gottschalkii]SES97507.1 hypothetical protein SAMN03080614_102625 [Anaerobranca gottschalkii DSM 13577]